MSGTALATPPITSNLVVWLDASDAETRKGYGVHTWYDKAARPFIELHGNNGTQYEDSEYSPLWGVNMQNGLGVLTFAAKRDYLVFDTYDYMDGFGDDDYSIWVVASTNTDPGGGGDTIGLLSSGAGDLDEDGFEFRWSIERFQYSTCCPHNSDLTVDYDSPLNRGQVYILNVNRVGGNIDGSIDGRIVVSSSSPGVSNDSTGSSYIGTITPGDPGEGYLDGDIAEILNLQRRWPSRCCG